MRKNKKGGFLCCAVYMAVLGVLSFIIGRLLPKSWFKSDRFPYRCNPKEKKLYDFLHVKSWQAKVPDMSKLFTHIMPAKRIDAKSLADVPRMLQETCVAEFTHSVLSVLGLAIPKLWPGVCGFITALIYILFGNVPFIIIQRYNRPRLQKLYELQQRKTGGH